MLIHRQRFKLEVDVGVGALAAGLFLIDGAMAHTLEDLLLVGHAGLAVVAFHVELAFEAVEQDFEVQLAHTADDRLSGVLIHAHGEGRVLLGEAGQRIHQLVLIILGLGLHGHRDDGFGELDVFQGDRMSFVGKTVAGMNLLHAHEGDDIAGLHALQLLLLVGVHEQDFGDALAFAGGHVPDGCAGLEGAGIYFDEGEFADIRVGGDFEGEG